MDKPYKLEISIELGKGYDNLEKQQMEIQIDDFAQATEIWKALTGILQQYSKIKAFDAPRPQ